ncbi:PREDICTED: ribosomal RNA-processing protein 17 [Rhagoletis zephyria]|uniref:ribosomal RNA-processing protein 17 n=1 Tax=Rhagoletis zephyria TaxID=28612 RepID=UPI00081127BB|nr:PREDICTED: ribosomal RNA-processing protein 17 [Rhagoletis zephyria]
MRKKEIIFDPEKRKNFLSGFRKRKNERRARAKEQLEQSIKEERKRIRNDLKNCMVHMKKTFQPLSIDPELEEKEKEYEDDEVQINVIELTASTLPKNREEDVDEDSNASDASGNEPYIDSIPGMELKAAGEVVKKKEVKYKSKQEEKSLTELGKIGSKKMLDRLKKKKALKEFKKSKVFKQKVRIEKKKQQKSSRRERKFSKKGPSGGGALGNKGKSSRFKGGNPAARGRRK